VLPSVVIPQNAEMDDRNSAAIIGLNGSLFVGRSVYRAKDNLVVVF
jgi:hypothetical protein